IEQIKALSDVKSRSEVETFGQTYAQLSASWKELYLDIGRDQSRAITEMVMHAEPLSQKVLQDRLPSLQATEKRRVEQARSRYDEVAGFTNRITVVIFFTTVLI